MGQLKRKIPPQHRKHRAYHSWKLVFRNPADFTREIRQISGVKSGGFHEIKNVSFCVMIKYRSFFRKTNKQHIGPLTIKNYDKEIWSTNTYKVNRITIELELELLTWNMELYVNSSVYSIHFIGISRRPHWALHLFIMIVKVSK